LSFDGKWAIALDPVHVEQLRIIPTGIGEAHTLTAPPGTNYLTAAWMPDDKRLLIVAIAPGHAPASYLQDIATGAARRVTAEGRYSAGIDDTSMNVSPDGKYSIVTDGEYHYWVQPLDGGEATEVKGLLDGDHPLQWHNDSENIFIERAAGSGGVDIYDLNLATGTSKLWTHFSPSDKAAMIALRRPIMTPDGAYVLYGVQRIYSTLFLAKGIQ
jgi:Tol biopolymer transport system component